MELWIARDKYGLCLYTEKPYLIEGKIYTCDDQIIPLEVNLFSEVTFENSPQKVKLELMKG